jgi:hypothetical protein
VRHRLEKRDPNATISDAVQPITYYLDPGAPEPIRSALLEGARWWSEAFEAAGFRNAWRVEMLPGRGGSDGCAIQRDPVGAPLHARVVLWGNHCRSANGPDHQGQVTLGSLRVLQDYLIAQGLIAKYEQGQRVDPRMEQMALARLRQLAAHQVGHTLGLQHNFAASNTRP